MDFVTKHWAPFRRRFPLGLPLVSSDYLPNKAGSVEHRFKTCNFSIILRGEGMYERDGKTWIIRAPCVITQWPGEMPRYGPDSGTWTEWYLVYPRSMFRVFQQRGLIDPSRPVWPVADPASVHLCLAEFANYSRRPDPSWVVDRVDRVAERALLATWLAPGAPGQDEPGIQAIARALREDLARPWDFAELAAEHGYSITTFRRRWVELFERPPAESLRHLRIVEACRLLVETPLRIKEVSAAVGFEDELYFSRRFHADVGHAPRDYRKIYRLSH
jgi:AraC-like DNA-binding protein